MNYINKSLNDNQLSFNDKNNISLNDDSLSLNDVDNKSLNENSFNENKTTLNDIKKL